MKNIKTTMSLMVLLLIIAACSSGGSDNGTEDGIEASVIQHSIINSYSKDFGYSGEIVKIIGSNFTNDINSISIFFDEVEAEVNSVTSDEIEVILPITDNVIPALKVEIENRIVTNIVENTYKGNIGVLNSTPNIWHKIPVVFSDELIHRSQNIGKDKMYFSLNDNGGGGTVYRTLDGGITWQGWSPTGFEGAFYATTNDGGWSDFASLIKVEIGGDPSRVDRIFTTDSSIAGIYVNDDMKNGTIITTQKVVYGTFDGVNFFQEYNNNSDIFLSLFKFCTYKESIWAGGVIKTSNEDSSLSFFNPLVLCRINGIWEEVTIQSEVSSGVNQLQFLNEDMGFASIKEVSNNQVNRLFRSIDGGASWDMIYDSGDLSITSFAFKDENIGWYASEGNIYKTINGGIDWELDYSHTSEVKNISYSDNLVWGISKDAILKLLVE